MYDSTIKRFTNNQANPKIMEMGSMKLEVKKEIACEIFSHCVDYKIDLYIEWILRELNNQTDFISEIRDCDDWQITSETMGCVGRTKIRLARLFLAFYINDIYDTFGSLAALELRMFVDLILSR